MDETVNNPLKSYLDGINLSVYQFSKYSEIPPSTLYPVYRGERKPRKTLVKLICKVTSGKLTLKDFGFEELKNPLRPV